MHPLRALLLSVVAAAASIQPASADAPATAASVELLARVGRASGPTFSPDGRQLALVSDLSGVPQVWIVPAEGGWPRLVTSGNDPVGGVRWSPTGDWLAFSLLPGGGLNSQIYVVRPTAAACAASRTAARRTTTWATGRRTASASR